MKQQNKILDLTNSDWKAQKKWNKVGLKISKSQLTKPEKIANVVAVINIPLPTASVITSPIIIKMGQKIGVRERVKLR